MECLKEANKHFEVVVFTAGTKNYANSILDILDPTGELIQHRLYRDSCLEIKVEGTSLYVKDLRILGGRSLEDIVIVDNAVISFAYQIDNGIPILPFREDKEDTEFLHLIKIMKDISKEQDCRNFVRRAFKLNEIMSTDINSYIQFYEMSDSEEDLSDDDCLDLLAQCQKSLSLSAQKSEPPKGKPKKLRKKKSKRISLKGLKKHRSEYVSSTKMIDANPSLSLPKSQKCILPEQNLEFPY